jgi:D-glycero-alpha-D-manno-heptose 1-phosphate guanylyltransferase
MHWIGTIHEKRISGEILFEKDYLEKEYKKGKLFGIVQEGYFIDIGIPEDFERATAGISY